MTTLLHRRRRAARRRSQAERRAEGMARVLDATVECLARYGYAGATTTRIARRAGVSRGALLHYYPSKAELLVGAVEHILRCRNEEFRAAFAARPAATDRAEAAIDILWPMFSGSTFYAWLELLVASRNDRALRAHMVRISQSFTDTSDRTYRDLFPAPDSPNPFFDVAPTFTFALLQGLALDHTILEDDTRVPRVLETLKRLAAVAFATPNDSPKKEESP